MCQAAQKCWRYLLHKIDKQRKKLIEENSNLFALCYKEANKDRTFCMLSLKKYLSVLECVTKDYRRCSGSTWLYNEEDL